VTDAAREQAIGAAVAGVLGDLPEAIRACAAPAREALAAFLVFLSRSNQETNLVSARAAEPAALAGHLRDALFGLPFLPPPRRSPVRLLDVGSGGGFPAIPLLLVRRDVSGTLVDSVGKKCAFLSEACRRLSLTAEVLNARFPDSFPMATRGPFDVLTTRAVGSAGRLVSAARRALAPDARALLWTTEPLVPACARDARAKAFAFHRDPGSERRGILVLERFT
jgi:16S rRNA (guanine527-N7)-methyltransferase